MLLDDVGLGASSAYGGGGLGKGGTVTLYLDGQPIGSGRVERTEPIGFGYEHTDVAATPSRR